jgi:ubiquinol-cytochrome c reductase cytochrome c1 subunit
MQMIKQFTSLLLSFAAVYITVTAMQVDTEDLASLQRGARTFMNYCSGCHSLKHMRHDALAQQLGITDESGKILEKVVKEQLAFANTDLSQPIVSNMHAEDALKWFGTVPPDLSLVARARGVDWLFAYLTSFYTDQKRPWGVNNKAFPDVAMPHALLALQGEQNAALMITKAGKLSKAEYEAVIVDLVNFLYFIGEPQRQQRIHIGVAVLMFLGIALVFSYLLKREYWKDI